MRPQARAVLVAVAGESRQSNDGNKMRTAGFREKHSIRTRPKWVSARVVLGWPNIQPRVNHFFQRPLYT